VANVFSILLSLWRRLFARRRVENTAKREAAAATVVTTNTPEAKAIMSSGFDMRHEIAKLAERIIEPVAGKLAMRELDAVAGQIRHAFEQQLNTKKGEADTSFEERAVSIMKPLQPLLSDVEFTRVVDRLNGAMAGFCQGDDWGPNRRESH
jgi:hypothetical protein